MLNRGQLEEFAQRGFLVLPGVVPQALVDAAARAIDELIDREPPGADARGPFNYFPVSYTHLTLPTILLV